MAGLILALGAATAAVADPTPARNSVTEGRAAYTPPPTYHGNDFGPDYDRSLPFAPRAG